MTNSNPNATRKFTKRISGIVIPVFEEQGRLRIHPRTNAPNTARVAPAFYVGWQEGANQNEGFSLYTLLKEIPGHSQWSTVSGKTLVDAGFMLPSREIGREHAHSQTSEFKHSVESARTAA